METNATRQTSDEHYRRVDDRVEPLRHCYQILLDIRGSKIDIRIQVVFLVLESCSLKTAQIKFDVRCSMLDIRIWGISFLSKDTILTFV